MMKVCTHAGLRRREKRLFTAAIVLVNEPPRGDGDRSGEVEGLRAGAGRRELDRDLRTPRPDSRA
jgi:hypothetical protein